MVKQIFQGRTGWLRLAGIVVNVVAMVSLSAVTSLAGWHDPMRPLVETTADAAVKAVAEEFHLEAIVVSGQRRVAVIDGKSLKLGDIYQGYRVKSIAEGDVTLKGRSGQKHLSLQPTIVTRINGDQTSAIK